MKASLNNIVHAIVRQHGRKKLRIKLETIHNELLLKPSFRQTIHKIFQ